MNRGFRMFKPAVVTIALAGLLACNSKGDKPAVPDRDFSRYISGHTSGMISARAAVRIEFAEEIPNVEHGAEVKERLFSFSPPIKGGARWKNSRTIEFKPDEKLKGGASYTVDFNLGKVLPDVENELRTFSFDVHTIEQDFSIKETFYSPVDGNQNRWNSVPVEVWAADTLTDEEARSIFSARLDGKAHPARLVSSSGGLRFLFLVDSIERASANRALKLACDGKAVGGGKKADMDIVIHALDSHLFKAVGARNCEAPERCVRIIFTDPLNERADLRGIVALEGVKNYTLKVDKNVVTIFPETTFPENITGRVDKNIRSFAGKRLSEDFAFSLNRLPDAPVVRLLHMGTIMPDSRNVLFPFSAINLRAVEMRIIKIYERNVLSFLQENSFDGSSELTRVGRLIAKKLLRLDDNTSRDLASWNNYAVDLSALVAKEPGAIYRVELIIRPEFSVYPCGDGPSQEELSAALDENNFVLTDDDFEVWNRGHYYYPPTVAYKYGVYDWRRRKDPCHPTFYMESDNTVVRGNIYATNVGVIAKKGDGAEILITAQDLRTTEPLAGGDVKILNYQLAPIAAGVTDGDGFCRLPVKLGEAFIAEVTHGGQKGYLKVNDGNELSLSRFDVGGKAVRKGLKGFIYGERGVWRPGDEIFMTFILEDREKTIPAGHPVTMDIHNPEGQFYRKLVQKEPVGNFYPFAFKTEERSPTGMWRAAVSVGGARFEKSFRVETIKPNRLKINVDFGTDLIDKPNLKISVGAKWLHGAAAGGLTTKALLKLNQRAAIFKGYEAYTFNDPAAVPYSHEERIFSGELDESGNTAFTADMPRAETAAGMLTATFITTVEERGGGESVTVNSLPYSPFPAYVGLNTHQTDAREILATDTTYYFDVAMVDPKGKPVASGELVYKAYRLEWSWWLDEDEAGRKLSSVISGNHVKPVIERKIAVNNGKARVPFKIASREWGRYLIYIKDPTGGHASGKQIFVDDPRWGGRSRQNDPQGLSMLTFTTDKQSYTVGEEVGITLGKAGNGRALVSLENGSRPIRQWWEQTKAGEPTRIRFNVTDDLTPNFYVHITMLQRHGQTVNDLPIRLYGVVPVTVAHPLGELKPTILMPDTLRSEKEFSIAVGEANKQGMTYTLAIVDEGLLDISNFKTPNPHAEFNVKEALGVKTYDRYNDVIGAFSGELKPLFGIGGGEDLNPGADKNSQRFKPIVKFLGPFQLKAGATGKHSVKLPPYIGSVRVMVVAANDRPAYGRAEKTVPVQNPLMALATLPRVLGPGEEALMPVNVFVADKAIRDVKIEVKAGDLLQLPEDASKSISFKEAGDQIAYFKMRVKKQTGKARVIVTASSGKETSTDMVDIEVRNPNPPLTVFDSYVVKPGESADIDYGFDDEQPGNVVKMEYARIPSVNLSGALQYLIEYPHGCAEQITSQAFPQLFLYNFADLSANQKREIQTNVNAVIQKLYSMQTADGGISYWSGGSQADDWVTSYAGHFMASAKDHGYHVSQTFINDWKKYQRSRVRSWNSGSNYRDGHLQAYRLYSMAVMGEPDLAAMNKLMERAASLPPAARWQLASAYAVSGRKDAARQIIRDQKAQGVHYPAFNNHFGSKERDDAIILETCILLDDMEEALTIARRVSDYLNGNNYSTQTTAWALFSMARFAGKSGKGDMSFAVSHQGKTNKVETKAPVYMEDLAQVKKSGKVSVANNGSGNLYVGRAMISTPFEDNSPAVDNKLGILVRYADLNGKTLDVTDLKQGTDFTATVSVTHIGRSSAYTNLALTHIVPSGWEIFNTRLADNRDNGGKADDKDDEDRDLRARMPRRGADPSAITYQDIRDDRVLSYFDLTPGQTEIVTLRLQAAYSGRFFMPAVACQAMYDNTVYARTAGGWVKVNR